MADKADRSAWAWVNKIIPLSAVDGPGARTAVFVQGCNLSCVFCHNPETQRLCRHCGVCVPLCPSRALERRAADGRVTWNAGRCVNCDRCLEVCPYYASPKVRRQTAAETFAEIEPYRPFIRGITVSGGEATLYPRYVAALFHLAKTAGLSTLIDANGTVPLERRSEMMRDCDGVMLDLKAWNPECFQKLTGGGPAALPRYGRRDAPRYHLGQCLTGARGGRASEAAPANQAVPGTVSERRPVTNAALRQNLRYLAAAQKLAEIRLVFMPGRVDAPDCLAGVAATIPGTIRETPLKLIAFRTPGVPEPYRREAGPTAAEMDALRERAWSLGFGRVSCR